MKKLADWASVVPEMDGPRAKLMAGGYVVRITGVTDMAANEYLKITYDIAEGPETGRFSDDWGKANEWAHSFSRFYTERSKGQFKGFIKAVEESNKGFVWGWNESSLVGKLVGVVIGEEEYLSNRGEIASKMSVRAVISADRVRKGEYVVPDIKRYKPKAETAADGPTAVIPADELIPDQNIPF